MSHAKDPVRRECLLPAGGLDVAALRARAAAHPAALAQLRADAETAFQIAPPSVLEKAHTPPSGDKRDYFSLSVYYWPDPEKPDGLPYVYRDGQINPETEQYDRLRITEMAAHVDRLAIAYAVTGEERYAERAALFLRTWFVDERSAMRPNMLFAQYIPGDNVVLPWKEYPARFVPGSGGRKGIYVSFGGVIEDLLLIPITDSVRLLRGSPHWTAHDDATVREWYRTYAEWLLTHQHGLDEAACRNNHGSWYWAGIACFLEFAGRPEEARRHIEGVLASRLQMQIEPDGSQPEELHRAISKHYVAFTLCSFVDIAIACERCGYDAWTVATGDGRSIRKAIDWFLPYLLEDRPWTWPQIKPYHVEPMIGALAACARRFPEEGYAAALKRVPGLPADHFYRLLFDL
jgi:hypothetical protein